MLRGNKILILPQESYQIMKLLFNVQNELGTGFQEKHYQRAVVAKLRKEKIFFGKEVPIHLTHDGADLGIFYMDITIGASIDKTLLLELKTVPFLTDEHLRQVVRYLIATNIPLGILVNFRVRPLQYKRIVNPNYDKLYKH